MEINEVSKFFSSIYSDSKLFADSNKEMKK